MLYRSTDRLSRRGAPVKNLTNNASFESFDKDAPSKPGTKHLGMTFVHRRAIACRLSLRLAHIGPAFRVAVIACSMEMVDVNAH